MSPVGHSLVGLAIGSFAQRRRALPRRRIATGLLLVAVANLPDWPLPGWGHSAYHVSHSLLVNAALILSIGSVLLASRSHRSVIRCWGLCSVAWLSHLLLDSMYGHGLGLAIGWPVSDFRLTLPVPWLRTLDLAEPPWSSHNLSVALVELLTFGPLLLTANSLERRRSAATTS
ncbi:MAG: metal-dependent hydrolase [Planctomycetota bacterium]